MDDILKVKPPVWFWIVSVLALVWNSMGVMSYLGTTYVTEDMKVEMTASQLSLLENTPEWVTAAFALAVFSGLLGSLGLLLRKLWARPLFVLSLIAILAQMSYSFFMSNAIEAYGEVQALVMPLLVIAIGIALLLFARYACKRHWLR
jgi:hypothetical protein